MSESKNPRRRSVQLLIGFTGLVAMIALLAIQPKTTIAEEPQRGKAAPKKEKLDQPGEAARFRAILVSGGKKDDKPLEISATAMPKAIERVRQLRGDVAQKRFNKKPQAMMIEAAAGKSDRVAGVPVGPLAAVEVTLKDGAKSVRPRAIPLGTATALDPSGWHWIGPGNIGGRTRSIVVHPTDPLTIWLGGVAGGVWRSSSGGVSWSPMTDFMANMAISCMAIDPTNPNRLWAGTGEGFNNLGSVRGFGIFTTEDGGLTWNQLASTAGAAAEEFRFVNRIAVAQNGMANTMLVATRTGLFRSTDNGTTFTKLGGVVVGLDFNDVRIAPTKPANCEAATDGAVYFSVNGGTTWTKGTGIPTGGRVEITYSRKSPDTLFASVDQNQGAIYRSINAGANFNFRSNPQHLSGQGWYANCLWADDPTDENLLLVGGLDLHRSANGGQSFTKISNWMNTPTSPHADHHVIVSHPNYNGTTNRTVFFGNDGGIYRGDDVKTANTVSGWQELNNGLGITQFYGIAVNQTTGKVTGGTQDNGTLIWSDGASTESWSEIFGGDGGFSAAHPTQNHFYGEYVNMLIHRGDGVNESAYITDTGANTGLGDPSPLFISPFVLDPNNPDWLLCGGAGLYRTKNASAATPSFDAIKPQVSQNSISAIAVAKGNSRLVWVGYAYSANVAGRVHRTKGVEIGNSWLPPEVGLPSRYVSRIVIDPTDTKVVYVLFTGYETDNLYKTTDGGTTWSKIGADTLPEVPFFDMAVHPDNAKHLYLGTEVGLFVSDDGGATWSPTNQGPTNAPVQNLVWRNKTLYAGTYGRGIFTINLGTTTPVGPVVPAAAPSTVAP